MITITRPTLQFTEEEYRVLHAIKRGIGNYCQEISCNKCEMHDLCNIISEDVTVEGFLERLLSTFPVER